MKKVILIPDSFKGTMSSAEICTVMAQAVQEYYPDAQVHSVPVADGGEGSVDSFLQAVGGEKVSVPVKGPYFEEVPAFYGMLPDGVAVIEMAAAAGLPLVGERLHAEQTTTYGVGELMAHALERGCKRLVVGLGGSATNDGGCGAAAALGAVFRNAAGGMGGGMVALFGSTLQMGIETVLDTVGFDKLLEGADMVFSGEGKLDAQSLLGKVVIGVARRAKRAGVPLVAVVGDIGDNIEAAYDMGVSAVFSINRVAVPFREAKPRSKSDLALTMDNLMRFCRRMGW